MVLSAETLKYYAKSLEKPLKQEAGSSQRILSRRESQREQSQPKPDKPIEKINPAAKQSQTGKILGRAEAKTGVGTRSKPSAEHKVHALGEIKRRQVGKPLHRTKIF